MSVFVQAGALQGIQFFPVRIEVAVAPGLPSFVVVGLTDTAIQESKERVRSAIRHLGRQFPRAHVSASFLPAGVRKEGSGFDVPLALGVLAAAGVLPGEALCESTRIFCGELSLDGTLRGFRGILPLLLGARGAGVQEAIIPPESVEEARFVQGMRFIAPRNLAELVAHLRGERLLPVLTLEMPALAPRSLSVRLSDIYGQPLARRALVLAAAGGHHVLFVGSPGSGKTMLAHALPGIMPALSVSESLTVSQIWSAAGIFEQFLQQGSQRPFRSPHHTSSTAALLGGGRTVRPGEVSLAHEGALFLDEITEYSRESLEALREPMEDGVVTIARASGTMQFPARFLLCAAMNPCPCGYSMDSASGSCPCLPHSVRNYRLRMSGPLFDRFDLVLHIPRLPLAELVPETVPDFADPVAAVQQVRTLQAARAHDLGFSSALAIPLATLISEGLMERDARRYLEHTCEELRMSARGYTKAVRVARTLADIAGASLVRLCDAQEALQYRMSWQDFIGMR